MSIAPGQSSLSVRVLADENPHSNTNNNNNSNGNSSMIDDLFEPVEAKRERAETARQAAVAAANPFRRVGMGVSNWCWRWLWGGEGGHNENPYALMPTGCGAVFFAWWSLYPHYCRWRHHHAIHTHAGTHRHRIASATATTAAASTLASTLASLCFWRRRYRKDQILFRQRWFSANIPVMKDPKEGRFAPLFCGCFAAVRLMNATMTMPETPEAAVRLQGV